MPPFIRGVPFTDAVARLESVGWQEHTQRGSHLRLVHPNMPGVSLIFPDHRRHDVDPAILGRAIELAGLTREQFLSLTGSGRRRGARQICREVYGMED